MKLLGSTENKTTKDKSSKNILHLEITEVVSIYCSIVNNDYQQDSRVLYKFIPNKPFGSLLEITPTYSIFFKNIWFIFFIIEVWFTEQSSQPLDIEDTIHLTLVIKVIYK